MAFGDGRRGMAYGDYILWMWNNLDDVVTLWYITLEDAAQYYRSHKCTSAILRRDVGGRQEIVFAFSRSF